MKSSKKPTMQDTMRKNATQAEALLKQLANSNRLMILCALVQEEKSVGELAEYAGLSQSALSQHLAKMRASGLVGNKKKGKMVYYHIASHEAQALLSVLYLAYCKPS